MVTEALAPRRKQNWTVDDPPEWVVAFVRWYVWERKVGDTIKSYQAEHPRGLTNLSTYQRDPRFIELLERELRLSNAGPMRVQQVLDMLHEKAVTQHDERAAKIYLEAVGKMAPRHTTVDVNVTDTRSLSDEQLHAELRRAITLLETRELSPRSGFDSNDVEVIEDSVIEDTEQGKK